MKNTKKELALFVILLIFLPFISALEVKLSKSVYSPRETLQAEISGNFLSLKSENLMIYKQGKVHSEPVLQGLTNQDRIYYFYAILPNEQGNYSLKIENAEYIESGNYKSDPITIDFLINKTNESSLSINPGFIFTNKDFSLKVKALDKNQNIIIKFENQSFNKTLYEESEETISFSIKNIPTKTSSITLGKYSIPVFIVNDLTNSNTPDSISKLDFSIKNITAVISPNKTYFFTFYIENNGQKNLANITLNNTINLILLPYKIDIINIQEKKQINMTVFIPENQKKNISGNISLGYSNSSIALPVFFEITNNSSKVTLPGINSTNSLSCKNIGKICLTDEECKGQLTPSLEGTCCIGECQKKKQSSSNWIYGIILLIIVIAIAGFILWKYKQKKNLRPKSIDEIMREKVDLKKLNAKKNLSKTNPHEEDI